MWIGLNHLRVYRSISCKYETHNGEITSVFRVYINYSPQILNYSVGQSPSWKAKRFSASQEIPRILWNPKVLYSIHKCPPLVLIVNRSIQSIPPHTISWRSILILSSHLRVSPKWSLSFRFPHQNTVYASPLPHTSYMPIPSYCSQFYQPQNIGWKVQIIELLIMQLLPLLCYLVPFRPKYEGWNFNSGNYLFTIDTK